MKLGNQQFRGDELDITDKLPNKECLLFRGGELDITVNKKSKTWLSIGSEVIDWT